MWSSVEDELANILSTRVFHTLADESRYVAIFEKAGFKGKLPTNLAQTPPKVREQLNLAARDYARVRRLDVASKNSLRERRAKAVVLEGPDTLYRLWSNKDENRVGAWWFSSNLLRLALTESDHDRSKSIEWLRDRLAISLDFGACDRLAALNLGISSALPAIAAWGLPMPHYSAQALQKDPSISQSEYDSRRMLTFQGQKTQYYLPFIPVTRVEDYW